MLIQIVLDSRSDYKRNESFRKSDRVSSQKYLFGLNIVEKIPDISPIADLDRALDVPEILTFVLFHILMEGILVIFVFVIFDRLM